MMNIHHWGRLFKGGDAQYTIQLTAGGVHWKRLLFREKSKLPTSFPRQILGFAQNGRLWVCSGITTDAQCALPRNKIHLFRNERTQFTLYDVMYKYWRFIVPCHCGLDPQSPLIWRIVGCALRVLCQTGTILSTEHCAEHPSFQSCRCCFGTNPKPVILSECEESAACHGKNLYYVRSCRWSGRSW